MPRRSGERQVRLDPIRVRFVDFGRLRHVTLAFRALRGKQMSARGVLTHDLARAGDLESFRDGLPGLAARDRFRHRARKIAALPARATAFALGCDYRTKFSLPIS